MAGKFVRWIATAASLAALLVGLSRGWEFWSIVQRMVVVHVAALVVGAALVAMTRLALAAEPRAERKRPPKASRNPSEGGTKPAV